MLDLLCMVLHEPLRVVDFTIAVEPPIGVHRIPLAYEWVGIAEVDAQIPGPFARDRKAVYHVACSIPILLIDCARCCCPNSIAISCKPHTCQLFKHPDIACALFCQRPIISKE